jgi:hypothetical protein
MRFFMFLSSHSEKTQPVCLSATAASASQHQGFPMCQGVVGLGLGFSGLFHLSCAPALASFAEATPQESAVALAPEPVSGLLDTLPFETAAMLQPVPSFQPVPSLSASAQAISLKGSSAKGGSHYSSHYGGYSVAVEDSYRPQFSSPACELSACAAHKEVVLRPEKVGSEGNLAAELVTLLNHPALGHVSNEDISKVQTQLSDNSVIDAGGNSGRSSVAIAQVPDFFPDELSEEDVAQRSTQAESQIAESQVAESQIAEPDADEELGSLRVQLQRSRESEELGILRLLQTAQPAQPAQPPPEPPVAFLSGRLGFFATDNVFRSQLQLDDQVFQSGITAYYFPKLSESTNFYAIAETSLARYGNFGVNYTQTEPRLGRNFPNVDYNQTELQLGLRQRLLPRTYAQIGWRNQRIYSPGYRDKLFGINYLEAQLNHRSILNSKTWLDGFYQVRWGFASPTDADLNDKNQPRDTSRVRQTFTLSLNYSATPLLRTSLLYQLDFEDYTQMDRFDTYQQVIGIVSYNLTPESQLSVFGGTRFGRSSSALVNLDDTFYGAGLNISVPLF